jgi:hypothetical protein
MYKHFTQIVLLPQFSDSFLAAFILALRFME